MNLGEVVGLHFTGLFGAAEPHGCQHGECAGDTVVTACGIVVKGRESRLGDLSHFVGNGFNK